MQRLNSQPFVIRLIKFQLVEWRSASLWPVSLHWRLLSFSSTDDIDYHKKSYTCRSLLCSIYAVPPASTVANNYTVTQKKCHLFIIAITVNHPSLFLAAIRNLQQEDLQLDHLTPSNCTILSFNVFFLEKKPWSQIYSPSLLCTVSKSHTV